MTDLTSRLNSRTVRHLPPEVAVPQYDRNAVSVGIAHFGVGGFHRAHQAMYVDRLLQQGDTNWGICGIGVLEQDRAMRDALREQDGLYTLVLRSAGDEQASVVGSIVDYIFAPDEPDRARALLTEPSLKIASLTITENGYNVDQVTGQFVADDPRIQAELQGHGPATVFGCIVRALQSRRALGIAPFTVLGRFSQSKHSTRRVR